MTFASDHLLYVLLYDIDLSHSVLMLPKDQYTVTVISAQGRVGRCLVEHLLGLMILFQSEYQTWVCMHMLRRLDLQVFPQKIVDVAFLSLQLI